MKAARPGVEADVVLEPPHAPPILGRAFTLHPVEDRGDRHGIVVVGHAARDRGRARRHLHAVEALEPVTLVGQVLGRRLELGLQLGREDDGVARDPAASGRSQDRLGIDEGPPSRRASGGPGPRRSRVGPCGRETLPVGFTPATMDRAWSGCGAITDILCARIRARQCFPIDCSFMRHAWHMITSAVTVGAATKVISAARLRTAGMSRPRSCAGQRLAALARALATSDLVVSGNEATELGRNKAAPP